MKQYLLGALSLLLVTLICVLLWIGLLSVMVQPGNVSQTGAFTIDRPVYMDTPQGRLYPAMVEGDEWITYTVRVKR